MVKQNYALIFSELGTFELNISYNNCNQVYDYILILKKKFIQKNQLNYQTII